MNSFLKHAWKQIFPQPIKDTRIVITKNAKEGMGAWGISETTVRNVVIHGVSVKKNMIAQKCNGYSIGTITKYDKTTKTYVVLSVWKKDWK